MKEIESIISAYDRFRSPEEQAVLGTLVRVEGSSYRRIGARIFVSSTGQWRGGISGGCLEGDALREAKKAMHFNKASLVVYDNLEDDPHQIGIGLGCNGKIEVLFKPIDKGDQSNPLEVLKRAKNSRDPQVILQMIDTPKHLERLMGQLYTEQEINHLIQAANIDKHIITKAIDHCKDIRKSSISKFNNRANEELKLLTEWVAPKLRLICIGDNYDVIPLLENAALLGWNTEVVGKQRKWNGNIMSIVNAAFDISELSKIEIDEYTAVILMSHNLKTDLKSLQHFIYKNIGYLGILGPQKRFLKLKHMLTAEDLAQLEFIDEKLFSPIGLDIGATSPEEIAHSICSEIIAHFRDRNGNNLKFREHTIHERTDVLVI